MATISRIIGREILDSRGNPTVETDVYLLMGFYHLILIQLYNVTSCYGIKPIIQSFSSHWKINLEMSMA